MKIRGFIISLVLLACASNAFAVLDIIPTFDDNPQVWSDVRKAVVNQAIQDWEDAFNAYDVDGTVYYSTQLLDAGGGTLAQTSNWIWGWEPAPGESTRPWLGTGHWMSVSPTQLWWDPTPETGGDVVGIDALTVVRHELGHVLGVWPGIWFDNYGVPGHTDLWESQIVGNVFDPGGLNVSMTADHGHTNGGLMNPYYLGGRTDVDATMDMFVLAYGLQPIPEPMTMTLLAMGSIAVLAKRRRSA